MSKIGWLICKLKGTVTCAKFEKLAYDFLDEKLDESQMKDIDKHMKMCPPCIHFMQSYRRTKELGKQDECPPLDPNFKEQLKNYLCDSHSGETSA